MEPRSSDIFITCVDRVGPFLKLWGQDDRLNAMFIEQLLKTSHVFFEQSSGIVDLTKVQVGIICVAKYKDGVYYRAQITNIRNLVSGIIEVQFIDYGNKEAIHLKNIKLLDSAPAGIRTIQPQAKQFILANVYHINKCWDDQALSFVNQSIAYRELKFYVITVINKIQLIKIMFTDDIDYGDYLVSKGIMTPMTLAEQENLLRVALLPRTMQLQLQPEMVNASVQSNLCRTLLPTPPQQPPALLNLMPTPESGMYKMLRLDPNSEHYVYVSFVEDGPYLFSIQLKSMETALASLMFDINSLSTLLPLSEVPLPGYPCMARCNEDNSVCRAVVLNVLEDRCKTFFVDFGNTDILPISSIFQIPIQFVQPKVMSMRFTLHGLKNYNITTEMKCEFKKFVTNRLLKLKVLKLENPLIHYCELYDEEDNNVLNLLFESNMYKTVQMIKKEKYSIIVSFIEGCKKFYVQPKETAPMLANLMRALAASCGSSPELTQFQIGTPCVALYPVDNQWYRAQIISITESGVNIKYVDYGNTGIVSPSSIKKLDPSFVKILPAQSVECCLYGYQNMSFNSQIESAFESLTLECEFSMKVVNIQDGTLLVDLFDSRGNNVAALLIEKLASFKSELISRGPLPACKVTRSLSLLNEDQTQDEQQEEQVANMESQPTRSNLEIDRPVRSSEKENTWKTSASDRRPQNDHNENWRNPENSPSSKSREMNQTFNGWNGSSPSNKRSDRPDYTRSNRENSYDNKNKFKSENNKRPERKFYGESRGNSNRNSGSESEQSWNGRPKRDFQKTPPRRNDYQRRNDSNQNNFSKNKVELPPQDLAPLEEPFVYPTINPGDNKQISISWFYNPEHFYCQFTSNQTVFRDLMGEIQSAYSGRPSVNIDIPIGASVIAEFQEDKILYRAVVLENKHPIYKVQYVDFGNTSLVEYKKIWQVEKKFMNLPIQATKCSIFNLKSTNENWPVSQQIDQFFNKDSFMASFQGCDEEKYYILLSSNDMDIKQCLIEAGLGVDPTTQKAFEEPIELSMLLSQTLNVKISFVQDLSKFYVHLEKEKAAEIHDLIQTYMETTPIESLQTFTEELLVVGTTCLVKVDDTTWKRGVITDLEKIQIDYPDFGGSGIYSMEQLYVLPSNLCDYWYQAFECSLHNLTDEVTKFKTDADFKNEFEGQDWIIYVDEVVESRLLVTLYETIGNKCKLFEPDEGAYPVVDAFCSVPILNSSLQVWVSHVNSVDSLYLQRYCDTEKIAALLQNLFEYYEAQDDKVTEVHNGELYATKSEDGNWYRSRVQEMIDNTMIKVLYIDYGNTEMIPKTNVRALNKSMFGIHEFAIKVGLNLQEKSDQLTAKLTELTTEKLFTANIFFGETDWLIDLTDGETSICQSLIDMKLAVPLGGNQAIETICEAVEPQADDNEPRYQIIITHIDSPSEFYVQLMSNHEFIMAMQADLQETIATLPDLDSSDVGVLCAAKYTVDEKWYRAEVLDADSEITTVRFIDYGNTDVITNNQGSIKTLPAELLAIGKYARKFSLNVMPLKGDEWSQEASEMFEASVNVDVIHADIVYQDEKNKTFVDLFVNGENIAQQLLDANVAIPIIRDVQDKIANNTGFVSHINSVAEFWIQTETSVADLEMIADRLASVDTFPDLQDLSPGILCAANFPDDEQWYRARILSNTVAGVEVIFVDYGNSSTSLKLKVLPEDLIQMPILAQKCALNKPANIQVWSEQATEKFREISADGVTIYTIKKLAAGETSVVELFINDINIVDYLTVLCDLNSAPKTPINKRNLQEVHIINIESPNNFWVHLTSDFEKIDDMMETLAAAGSFRKVSQLRDETICAALHENTGLWYRAKIYEIADEYEVFLIDYGKIIYTKELRQLPSEIEKMPPLATSCALELPRDMTEWTSIAIDNFNKLQGSSDYKIEFLDSEIPSKVRLFLNGKNIIEQLLVEAPKIDEATTNLTSEEVALIAENTELPEPNTDDDILESKECDTPEHVNEVLSSAKSSLTLNEANEIYTHSELNKHSLINDNNLGEGLSQFLDTISTNNSSPTQIFSNDTSDILEFECRLTADSNKYLKHKPTVDGIVSDENRTELIPPDSFLSSEDLEIAELITPDKFLTSEEPLPFAIRKEPDESVNTSEPEATSNEILTEDEFDAAFAVLLNNANLSIGELLDLQSSTVDEKSDNLELEISSETDILDTETDSNEGIVEVSVTDTNLINENLKPRNEICLSFELMNTTVHKQLIPHSEKIFSGSVIGLETSDDLPEKISEDIKEVPNHSTDSTPVFSRPSTPYYDKIVPGSICRGDLEVPVVDDDDIIETQELKVIKELVVQSRPATPHNDKIVPGSICRGEEKTKLESDFVPRPATPRNEKIVPGSIARGDLSEIPVDDEKEQKNNSIIAESIINDIFENITPRIPIEEKILPGYLTQEILDSD